MEAIILLIVYLISIPAPAYMAWKEVDEVRTTKRIKDIHAWFYRDATRWDLIWTGIWCGFIAILPLVNTALTVCVALIWIFEKLWKTKFIEWMKTPL
ncbi:hypothetical protein [Xanthomonas phage BUDD]|nr:hypothetical protein [Xanthomonas phage BUDD]